MGRREHISHFDLHTAAEDFGNLRQAMLLDIFVEDHANRFGDNGIQNLPLIDMLRKWQLDQYAVNLVICVENFEKA